MLKIRSAEPTDIPAILVIDRVAVHDPGRVDFIQRVVGEGACFLAEDDEVLGYAVLEYTFFEQAFISLVYIRAESRRSGAGSALVQYLETLCRTPKIFTSTNLSNRPMQALLEKLGYRLSGAIHDLDEGDPELIYVKYLGRN
jgi:ribosomal protein S18 acetylase RimI-like enzyme